MSAAPTRASSGTAPLVSGALPLVGHLPEFADNLVGLLRRGYAEHGRLFRLKLASRQAVVLLDHDDRERFFSEPEESLSVAQAYSYLRPVFGPLFFFVRGEFELVSVCAELNAQRRLQGGCAGLAAGTEHEPVRGRRAGARWRGADAAPDRRSGSSPAVGHPVWCRSRRSPCGGGRVPAGRRRGSASGPFPANPWPASAGRSAGGRPRARTLRGTLPRRGRGHARPVPPPGRRPARRRRRRRPRPRPSGRPTRHAARPGAATHPRRWRRPDDGRRRRGGRRAGSYAEPRTPRPRWSAAAGRPGTGRRPCRRWHGTRR